MPNDGIRKGSRIKTGTLLLIATALAALTVVATAATSGTDAQRQRIAIEGVFNTLTGRGTFRIVQLSPGELKADSGSFTGTGNISRSVIRNGQTHTPITGADSYTGKLGTLIVSQEITSVSAGNSFSSDRGSWSIDGGTGAYEGYKGGGGFAAVGTTKNRVFFRQEGYVSKR